MANKLQSKEGRNKFIIDTRVIISSRKTKVISRINNNNKHEGI